MKILIGDISSYKAIVVSKYIKKKYADIKIYTFDSRKYSNFCRTKYSDKHFNLTSNDINEYTKIIKKYEIDDFFPVINNTITNILANKDKFGSCLHYLGDYNTFKLLNDKKQLMSLAVKLGIKTPKTYDNIADAKSNCIIKPTNLSSAKGVKYIKTDKQLQKAIKEYQNQDNIIAQEYIEGVGVGYSVYAKNGNIIVGYGHKRLSEYPISGGSSVYRESYSDYRMENVASKLLKETNWTGFAMFEFKLNPENELYLIEVNPRIWGSINQGQQNGVNYFESLFGPVNHEKNEEVKTYLSPFIYMTLIKYLFKGNLKPLVLFIKNIKYNKADVSLWDDPMGWISTILRKML